MQRHRLPTSPLPSHRHWARSARIDFAPPAPDFPMMMMTRVARRGFECLIEGRGTARAARDELDVGVRCPEHAMPAFESTQIRVAVASTREEIEAAHHLVCKRYAWRGYGAEAGGDPGALRMHARIEQEITFVAANREATLGTVTLGLDGPYGLRAEETHGAIIQTRRASGRRVCELTRLAVAETADSKAVLASLFGLAYTAGRSIHDVTDVYIEVNPRHVTYYSRIMGFVVAAGERLCERVRAPSVLLHTEVDALAKRLRPVAEAMPPQALFVRAA